MELNNQIIEAASNIMNAYKRNSGGLFDEKVCFLYVSRKMNGGVRYFLKAGAGAAEMEEDDVDGPSESLFMGSDLVVVRASEEQVARGEKFRASAAGGKQEVWGSPSHHAFAIDTEYLSLFSALLLSSSKGDGFCFVQNGSYKVVISPTARGSDDFVLLECIDD